MKKIILAAVVGVLALGAHVVVNPLIAASSVRDAIEAKDGPALAQKIDFEALRADLRQELEVALKAETDPMAREMARGFLGGMLDEMVTEKTVTSWGQGAGLMPAGFGMGGGNADIDAQDYSLGFGLTNFTITLATEQGPIDVIMAPRGLTWKIVGVDIDPKMLGLDI